MSTICASLHAAKLQHSDVRSDLTLQQEHMCKPSQLARQAGRQTHGRTDRHMAAQTDTDVGVTAM